MPFLERRKRASWIRNFSDPVLPLVRTIGQPGRSCAESVAQLGIVLEEADETAFWLELVQQDAIFPEAKLHSLCKEANERVSIFVGSIRTAKGFTTANLTSDL